MKKWIVTFYDSREKIICQLEINDRTEKEAFNEAESYMPNNCNDWTMIERLTDEA